MNLLVEDYNLRSTSRVCDVSINTVTKVLVEVGRAYQVGHGEKVRGLAAKRILCDEIWSFTYAKQKNVPERWRT